MKSLNVPRQNNTRIQNNRESKVSSGQIDRLGTCSVKHGEGTGRQSTSITEADTAHTVENFKKVNFEVLEHPLYNLDLTASD
jgi:hypothetical protein